MHGLPQFVFVPMSCTAEATTDARHYFHLPSVQFSSCPVFILEWRPNFYFLTLGYALNIYNLPASGCATVTATATLAIPLDRNPLMPMS